MALSGELKHFMRNTTSHHDGHDRKIVKPGDVVFLRSGTAGIVVGSDKVNSDQLYTLHLFNAVLKDSESGLLYVRKSDYSTLTCEVENVFGSCVTAADDNDEDILWILNASRLSFCEF